MFVSTLKTTKKKKQQQRRKKQQQQRKQQKKNNKASRFNPDNEWRFGCLNWSMIAWNVKL